MTSENQSIEINIDDLPDMPTDDLFAKLHSACVEIEVLKMKYASNKSAATKLRTLLMEIIKYSTKLRKSVLDHKKAIPVKKRVKKDAGVKLANDAVDNADEADQIDEPVVEPVIEKPVIVVSLPPVESASEKKQKAPRKKRTV